MDALAELDQALPVEPDPGDVARDRLVDDRLRRGAEGLSLGEPDEALHLRGEIEVAFALRHEMVDEGHGDLAGLDADLLLAELVDHVVLAGLAGSPCLADADRRAGDVLQLERDVLRDVTQPRALGEPRQETAAAAERAGMVGERRKEP